MLALTGARIFDSRCFYDGEALLIEDGRIEAKVPEAEIPAKAEITRLDGGLLAPGFVDLQVNGGGGVLFNNDLSAGALHRIAAAHRRFGTTSFFPTLISDRPGTMLRARHAVWDAGGEDATPDRARILGVHYEGPFLNPARCGVHDPAYIRPITEDDIAEITALTGYFNRTLLTVAPECLPPGTIHRLSEGGVVVFAGHTEATPAEIAAARAEGLLGFTHLFNAMPPLTGRAPGPVGGCLADRRAFCTVIADGVHVDPVCLKIALRTQLTGAVILVTDAMPPVGADDPSFALYGKTITAADGRCATADGTLAGSTLDMATAVRNAVSLLGVDLADALCMASLDPCLVFGMDHLFGRLDPMNHADIVWLDDDLQVRATWVGGLQSPLNPA
ncbi:MAG: N-acetylglucosamine-6-phosphate deacetylase [Alphaproteobacteria bacterium]|jgi:N-acetylglucosamine-6-phosphate deacetylase|nr:N-acetylglucosamine-6-phosphate deacetylase [Alphaproteobacteria bacterium]